MAHVSHAAGEFVRLECINVYSCITHCASIRFIHTLLFQFSREKKSCLGEEEEFLVVQQSLPLSEQQSPRNLVSLASLRFRESSRRLSSWFRTRRSDRCGDSHHRHATDNDGDDEDQLDRDEDDEDQLGNNEDYEDQVDRVGDDCCIGALYVVRLLESVDRGI